MMRMLHLILALSFLLGVDGASYTRASFQADDIANVWGVIASTHQGYVSLFSPPQVTELYILADRQHVISPRRTRVYYWSIDREYKPDWAALNERLDGTLEILDARGRLIQEMEKDWYVLVPNLDGGGSGSLLIGDQSQARYEQYQERRQAYLNRVSAYDQALKVYLEQQEAGEGGLVQPPVLPEPFNEVDIQVPQQAFIISLPPGTYNLRLRDPAGDIVADTERRMIVISSRRQGVGYNVIPEEKWTRPERSDESDDRIYYTPADTNLYLQARRILEFNEFEFTRLTEPQNTTASNERWVWVPMEDMLDNSLLISATDLTQQQVTADIFAVEQLPGYALGYRVVSYDPEKSSRPDFQAYPIYLRGDIERYSIFLLNAAGEPIPGSGRVLVRASKSLSFLAWVTVLAPLLIGLWVRILRRRRLLSTVRKVQVVP